MLTSTPTLNNIQSSSWILYIPGYEELTIKLSKFAVPEITAGTTSLENRTSFILQESGDHIYYEDLKLEFLVDENLLNYRKLYRWMRSNTKRGIADTTSIFVHLMTNGKEFQGVEFEFLDAFPFALGELELDSDGNTTDLTCSVTFKYTGMDIVEETNIDEDWEPLQ